MESKNVPLIRAFYVVGGIVLGAMLFLAANLGQTAPMNTFTVNTILDTDDGTCDGVHCSLREAINAANTSAGSDTIEFSLPLSATIVLAGMQLPTIADTLTIDGSTAAGLTISGTNFSRVFHIDSGASVTLTALIISDGDSQYPNSGGALYNAGGVLTIIDSVFEKNMASFDGGAIYNENGNINILSSAFRTNHVFEGEGGAVYNGGGTVTISNSIFISNHVNSRSGGAIYNSGVLTIDHSIFNANYTWNNGGAIFNNNTLSIHNSTLRANWTRAGLGGALYNVGGLLNIAGSTLDSNNALDGFGGGVFNSGGVLHASNSTFSGNASMNSLIGGHGGGIANYDSGTVNLSSSTFSGNRSDYLAGGIYNDFGSVLNFVNTIIANSDREDCLNSGSIGTNIRNLVEDGGCSPALSGDPALGPLQDNGGPTWTHALTFYSPAVDAGNNAACAVSPVNNLDQRGVVRPIDGDGDGFPRCDIGAYEYPMLDESSYLPLIVRN